MILLVLLLIALFTKKTKKTVQTREISTQTELSTVSEMSTQTDDVIDTEVSTQTDDVITTSVTLEHSEKKPYVSTMSIDSGLGDEPQTPLTPAEELRKMFFRSMELVANSDFPVVEQDKNGFDYNGLVPRQRKLSENPRFHHCPGFGCSFTPSCPGDHLCVEDRCVMFSTCRGYRKNTCGCTFVCKCRKDYPEFLY